MVIFLDSLTINVHAHQLKVGLRLLFMHKQQKQLENTNSTVLKSLCSFFAVPKCLWFKSHLRQATAYSYMRKRVHTQRKR